jgi:hypothetical protein
MKGLDIQKAASGWALRLAHMRKFSIPIANSVVRLLWDIHAGCQVILKRIFMYELYMPSLERLAESTSDGYNRPVAERSHSGLVRALGKRVRGQLLRGFESLPLRHKKRLRSASAFLFGDQAYNRYDDGRRAWYSAICGGAPG